MKQTRSTIIIKGINYSIPIITKTDNFAASTATQPGLITYNTTRS